MKDKCNGEERHRHFALSLAMYITHSHPHMEFPKDFNRLHHHSPLEHDGFTNEELEKDLQFAPDEEF